MPPLARVSLSLFLSIFRSSVQENGIYVYDVKPTGTSFEKDSAKVVVEGQIPDTPIAQTQHTTDGGKNPMPQKLTPRFWNGTTVTSTIPPASIVGIVVGVLGGVSLLLGVAYVYFLRARRLKYLREKRRRKRRASQSASGSGAAPAAPAPPDPDPEPEPPPPETEEAPPAE